MVRLSTYFRQFRVPGPTTGPYEPLRHANVAAAAAQDGLVRLEAGDTIVEVTALAPDIFRVGMFDGGRPAHYRAEAVSIQDWPTHETRMALEKARVTMHTSAMKAEIQLNPLRLSFGDLEGRRFAEDDPELGMGYMPLLDGEGGRVIDPLGPPARVYKRRTVGERYFGCGERTGGLEKTDSHQVFWNIDPPQDHTSSLSNLYTSIPFVLTLNQGQAWGLFMDNPGQVEFDLAREDSERAWFGSDTGDLVYYVFGGPSPRQVVDSFTRLTGRTPMPPLWALGYHQSRWGRKSADEVVAIARELRERDIPCDALYLDIDYMDGFRVFTWDRERFPDPTALTRDLRELGIRLVTIVDPGVKVDESYPVYREGHDADLFLKNTRGREYQNVVWPGTCAFPDFTDPRARAWWGEKLPALLDHGVAGIWCDMNEPTMFIPTPQTLPPDVVHPGGAEPTLHAEVHNLYGSLMAQATREGLLRHQPDRRPFVISRAGYAGLQRHALHWTGDNTSWWEHLWMSMPQLQNLGISGLAWIGMDIGGFGGDATGELLARWMELGAFVPFCRNHSSWNTRAQEPWSFGEPYETVIRSMLKLRQRLIPYLYSLFDECHRTGAPIVRPLLYEFPDDEDALVAADELMLGTALLLAPIASAGATYRHVYLPPGTWFHFWSGERVNGPAHVLAHAPLGQPAMYVRGGYPLPLWPEMLHVEEKPADPLTLVLYPAGAGSLSLYEDAGDGFAHERGEFLRTLIESSVSDGVLAATARATGEYRPTRQRTVLEVRGWQNTPASVRLNGADHGAWHQADGTLVVNVPSDGSAWRLEVR
jgi:alpha-glucosidase